MRSYQINANGHYNIYTKSFDRTLNIEFSIPDEINENTGFMVLVPGFGGNINSNVYKKMRTIYPDLFNVITIQCEYFGSKFMQDDFKVDWDYEFRNLNLSESLRDAFVKNPFLYYELISERENKYFIKVKHEENMEEFADLGFMQAIDILTAIDKVKKILRENSIKFNENRVIGFGQSHGAYLLLLANRIMPFEFSTIIDLSSWIKPVYLDKPRITNMFYNDCMILLEHNYLAKELFDKTDFLSLKELYDGFDNKCKIYSFNGTDDFLVDEKEKMAVFKNTNYVESIIIDSEFGDGEIFFSNRHGLDADFLKLIELVMSKEEHINSYKGPLSFNLKIRDKNILVDRTVGESIFYFEDDFWNI